MMGTQHYFAFREPGSGCHISAMGHIPYDPAVPGDRDRAELAAASMAIEKVSSGYYPRLETIDVKTTYYAQHVGSYEAATRSLKAPLVKVPVRDCGGRPGHP